MALSKQCSHKLLTFRPYWICTILKAYKSQEPLIPYIKLIPLPAALGTSFPSYTRIAAGINCQNTQYPTRFQTKMIAERIVRIQNRLQKCPVTVINGNTAQSDYTTSRSTANALRRRNHDDKTNIAITNRAPDEGTQPVQTGSKLAPDHATPGKESHSGKRQLAEHTRRWFSRIVAVKNAAQKSTKPDIHFPLICNT
jgi:hypothetical protein